MNVKGYSPTIEILRITNGKFRYEGCFNDTNVTILIGLMDVEEVQRVVCKQCAIKLIEELQAKVGEM